MSWFQVARRTSHYKISMSAFSRLSTRIVKQTNKQTNWEIRQTWQLILRWSFQKLDFFISEIQLDKAWSYLHCFDGWDILKAVFTEAKQNIETYVTRKKKTNIISLLNSTASSLNPWLEEIQTGTFYFLINAWGIYLHIFQLFKIWKGLFLQLGYPIILEKPWEKYDTCSKYV